MHPSFAIWTLVSCATTGLLEGEPASPKDSCPLASTGEVFCPCEMLLGDVNSDALLNVTDVIALAGWLFQGTDAVCAEAADYDGSGTLNLTDVIGIAYAPYTSTEEIWFTSCDPTCIPEEDPVPAGDPDDTWRSELFPEDWSPVDDGAIEGTNLFTADDGEPGTVDADGDDVSSSSPAWHPERFLHDFSYAGYHRGEDPIPPLDSDCLDRGLPIFDVEDYGCDPDGGDCRDDIQDAIDDAADVGGGVVYIGPGEFTVTTEDEQGALLITDSNVVLCGAGSEQTFLKVDGRKSKGAECHDNVEGYDVDDRGFCFHQSAVVEVQNGTYAWEDLTTDFSVDIEGDYDLPTRRITLADTSDLDVGDEILIVSWMNDDFKEEHDMDDPDEGWEDGFAYAWFRTITTIDGDEIELDIPTRYRIRSEDDAYITTLTKAPVEEVGIEGLSIGMVKHPDDWDMDSCPKETPADCAEVEASDGSPEYPVFLELFEGNVVSFDNTQHSWMYDVKSYLPDENADDPDEIEDSGEDLYVEILNQAVNVVQSRNITIENAVFRNAQADEGSSNGYCLRSTLTNEILWKDIELERVKKGFAFNEASSGNVIRNITYKDILDIENDFHSYLAQANLIEGNVMDGTYWEAVVRPLGNTRHGHGGTQSVFWNNVGLVRPTIDSLNWDRDEDSDNDVDSDTSDDYGIIVSNQFGWGYIIGTTGAFSDVIAASMPNRSYEATDDSHPIILPKDHLEGIGYDTDPDFDGNELYPPSLHDAQLWLRLCGNQHGCP